MVFRVTKHSQCIFHHSEPVFLNVEIVGDIDSRFFTKSKTAVRFLRSICTVYSNSETQYDLLHSYHLDK